MKPLLLALMLLAAPLWAQQVPTSAAQIQLSFAPLVKEAAPAVVNIYAKIMAQPRRTPLQSDPFFERFFRDPFSEKPRGHSRRLLLLPQELWVSVAQP